MMITKTFQHSFPAVADHCLRLESDKGQVRVLVGEGEEIHCKISLTTEAASEADAQALLERVELVFDQSLEGSIVRSRVGKAEESGWGPWSRQVGRIEVDVTVTIPCRQNLVLKNGVGEIEIGHLKGNVHVRSGAGDIRIDAVQGEVRVEGGSGSIEVRDVTERIVARSGAGDVTLRGVEGPIQVTTLAGAVSVEVVGQLGDNSRITTAVGGILIALAASAGLDLHARTTLGQVFLRVPHTARIGEPGGTVHALHGGGPCLNVRTMAGRVQVEPLLTT